MPYTTRAGWFARLLIAFSTPASVAALTEAEFVSTATRRIYNKHSKEAVLRSFYARAKVSVGIPVPLESKAASTFRLLLEEHTELCRTRSAIERTTYDLLKAQLDYQILRSVPGIGSTIAPTIPAEARDLRRGSGAGGGRAGCRRPAGQGTLLCSLHAVSSRGLGP